MDRRLFLTTCVAAAGFTTVARGEPSALSRFKLGAISDGFSQNFEDALKMMASHGLKWVEIRNVFGIYNTEANATQVQQIRDFLNKYNFRVSVIDSAFYKCTLPGTTPVKAQKDLYPYADQMDLLKRACDRAHTLGAEKIRGFTFWRVAQPEMLSQRIADELEKASEIVRHGGLRLVIENEETCNAATGRELGRILATIHASNVGANWDVGNGYWQGEVSFPDGYKALDEKRIWHMHLKGVSCGANFNNCSEAIAGKGQNELTGQFRQLLRDGYHETMSLECEFHSPGLSHLETTKRSLEGVLRAMERALAG